jgi:MFS family permease
MSSNRRLFLVLALLPGLGSASYGVMFTVLSDFRDKYHISEKMLGLVVSVGFFTSFFSMLVLSRYADRGHAKRLVVMGGVLTAMGSVGMGYGRTTAALLVARALLGIGAGMLVPAVRRLVIVADPDNMGRNLGMLLSVDVGGFALGPVLSALTVDRFGLRFPFLLIATCAACALPFVVRFKVNDVPDTEADTSRLGLDLLKSRPLAGAILIGSALYLMIGTFDALWSFVMDDLDAPKWMARAGITVFVVPLILLGPFGGRYVQRVGAFRLGTLGLTIGSLCMFTYGRLPIPWMLLVVGLIHAINDGLTVTGTSVAVGQVAPMERAASAQGLLGACGTLMGGLSALAAGWSYHEFGRTTTYTGATVCMLVLIATGAYLAGPAYYRREPLPSPSPQPELTH